MNTSRQQDKTTIPNEDKKTICLKFQEYKKFNNPTIQEIKEDNTPIIQEYNTAMRQ